MDLNWDAIGAIGEIVGAVAVVATLGYLALQIRHENAANSINAVNSILQGFEQLDLLLAQDESLAALFNKGLWSPEKLTDSEAAQFSWMLRLVSSCYLKLFRLYQEGLASQYEWENHMSQAAYMFGTPGGRIFMDGHSEAFEDFGNLIRNARSSDLVMDLTMGRKHRYERGGE